MKEIALYVHIPFCRRKCLYCDFNSYERNDEDSYIEGLCKEITGYLSKEDLKFKTVFIGGGTPTFIKCENIEKIMKLITPFIKKDAEITIECNPDTVNKASLREYYNMGINRLSIGLQAKQNYLLNIIGRIHDYEGFLNCYTMAREEGFKNINIDLMFSLPNQDVRMWEETLKNICRLEPEHISCYSLILEESTPLYAMVRSGQFQLPDEDTDREMYYLAKEILFENGYKQYEISNFSKPGYKCSHNLIYWRNEEYLGVGAGSHSKIGQRRFWNIKCIDEYIEAVKNKKSPIEGFEDISESEGIWETIILNLRLKEGINTYEFYKKHGQDFMFIYRDIIKELINEGLLEIKGDNISLTEKGIDLSNMVFIRFLK